MLVSEMRFIGFGLVAAGLVGCGPVAGTTSSDVVLAGCLDDDFWIGRFAP